MFGKKPVKKPLPQNRRSSTTSSTIRVGGYTFDDSGFDGAIIDSVTETFSNNDSYDSSSDSTSDCSSD